MKTKIILCVLTLLMWSMNMVAQTTGLTKTERTDEKTGFKWTEVKDGDLLGVEVNGKMVVPCKYTTIVYQPGYFDAININTKHSACYKQDGTCIIPESRGYSSLNSYAAKIFISVYVNGKGGACDPEGKEIISPQLGYNNVVLWKNYPDYCLVEKNKFWGLYDLIKRKEVLPTSLGYSYIQIWTLEGNCVVVENNKRQGVYNYVLGKEIVPVSRGYTSVYRTSSDGFSYYRVEKDKSVEICDWEGNEIISTSRGYTSIVKHGSDGVSYFEVKKDNLEGACDLEGNEIVPPKYDSLILSQGEFRCKVTKDRWQSIGIRGDGSKVPGVSEPTVTYTESHNKSSNVSSSSSSSSYSSSTYSSSPSSSSSSTSFSSNSQYGNLLYEGYYTNTGVVRTSTNLSGSGQAYLMQMKVYEQILISTNENGAQEWPYIGIVTVYGITGRLYGKDNIYYLVNDVGLIWGVIQAGTEVYAVYFDKGDTRSTYIGKMFSTPIGNGGNVFSGGTFNNQQQPQNTQKLRSCTVCYGRGVCSQCSGSKWVTNSFGNKGLHKCGACGGTGLCRSCNGTGRRAYW